MKKRRKEIAELVADGWMIAFGIALPLVNLIYGVGALENYVKAIFAATHLDVSVFIDEVQFGPWGLFLAYQELAYWTGLAIVRTVVGLVITALAVADLIDRRKHEARYRAVHPQRGWESNVLFVAAAALVAVNIIFDVRLVLAGLAYWPIIAIDALAVIYMVWRIVFGLAPGAFTRPIPISSE